MLTLNKLSEIEARIVDLSCPYPKTEPVPGDYRIVQEGYYWEAQQYLKSWFGFGKLKWLDTSIGSNNWRTCFDRTVVKAAEECSYGFEYHADLKRKDLLDKDFEYINSLDDESKIKFFLNFIGFVEESFEEYMFYDIIKYEPGKFVELICDELDDSLRIHFNDSEIVYVMKTIGYPYVERVDYSLWRDFFDTKVKQWAYDGTNC